MCRQVLLLVILTGLIHTGVGSVALRPPPATVFIGSLDSSSSDFSLVRVALNSTTLALTTTLISSVGGWVLVQGDATAYDSESGVYYVTLSNASDPYAASALFAFNITSGMARLSFEFPINVTMGMMAWEASMGKVVGLCGSLMIDGSIDSYCSFDPVTRNLTPLYNFTATDGNRYFYDPDTRALDAAGQRYYARLYTEPAGPWMPDNIVTLNSTTGAVLNAVYGGGPEYAGTRFDSTSRSLWSGSNAVGGIDLCKVDPVTGSTTPTGAWVQHSRENILVMAATAAIDSPGGWFFTQIQFGSSPLLMTAVDITNSDISMDRIVYNFTLPTGGLISNMHATLSDPY